ncbi:MAG: phospholipid carrier-dependent glycosyltransferase [Anaerolineales bacterium]|nr:phospholipid carrier-dependent glycosyltransferase [Anaerolineales bacterium]
MPGIEWGAPDLWNPDELIWRVDSALRGEIIFDETEPDFNYPSLPKYVMYAIGWIVYGMGKSSFAFILTTRIFSAILGATSGILIYYLARTIGTNKRLALLSGLFYVISGIASANGRFAHNDLYLQFFTILCVYCVIKYQYTGTITWLYTSFLMVGFAASSKYTGGSLILLPILIFIGLNWNQVITCRLFIVSRLILGGLIAYLGYGIGTPKSISSPIYYFSHVIQALQNLTDYGFNFGTTIGLFGQWPVFKSAVGIFSYYLFIFAFLWFSCKLLLWKLGNVFFEPKQAYGTLVFIIAIMSFDLPFLISINYVERYFIPFVPFLAILSAWFVDEVINISKSKNWNFIQPVIIILLVIGSIYSTLRLVSISLLFIMMLASLPVNISQPFEAIKRALNILYIRLLSKKDVLNALITILFILLNGKEILYQQADVTNIIRVNRGY